MDTKQIKTLYPKSYEKLRVWIREVLEKWTERFLQNTPLEEREKIKESIPDIPEFNELEISTLLDTNIRLLYEFFDKQEIYITINNSLSQNKWYFFTGDEEGTIGIPYKSRIEAEYAAFEEAFKILEGQL